MTLLTVPYSHRLSGNVSSSAELPTMGDAESIWCSTNGKKVPLFSGHGLIRDRQKGILI